MSRTLEEMARLYADEECTGNAMYGDGLYAGFLAGYKTAQALINGRKIIQITGTTQDLIALCDDGTLWFNERAYDPKGVSDNCNWHKIRSIPQDE